MKDVVYSMGILLVPLCKERVYFSTGISCVTRILGFMQAYFLSKEDTVLYMQGRLSILKGRLYLFKRTGKIT